MSRFMIGKQLQGKGYGKQAAIAFFEYFKTKHNADKLYISVSLENILARKNVFFDWICRKLKEVEYTFGDKHYKEMQMVKEL